MPAFFNDDLHTLVYKLSRAVEQAASEPVYDPDAEIYFANVLAGSGTVISDAEKQSINAFFLNEKSSGRWNQAINYYTLQSDQNAGTGLIVYGLKSGSNGTITGPIWGSDGLILTNAGEYFSTPNMMSGNVVPSISFFSVGQLSASTGVASWVCSDNGFFDSPQHLALVSNASNLSQGFFPGISTAISNQSIPTVQTLPQVQAVRAVSIDYSSSNLQGKLIRQGDASFNQTISLPITGIFQPMNSTWKHGDLGGYTGQTFAGTYSFLAVFQSSLDTEGLYQSFKSTIGQGLNLP